MSIFMLLKQFLSMNRIIQFLILFLFLSCSSSKSKIEISQSKSNSSIIIYLSRKNTIIIVQFPNEITIKNNSFNKKSFVKINYKYNKEPRQRNLRIKLFRNEKGKLTSISTTGKKSIHRGDSLKYFYFTRHFIDSSKATQQYFKPYIAKMLKENKDTLHIGTVAEFKEKHKKLFKKLTQNDSISIRFLNGKKLGKRVTVPVEW